jgi:hypothetical protein
VPKIGILSTIFRYVNINMEYFNMEIASGENFVHNFFNRKLAENILAEMEMHEIDTWLKMFLRRHPGMPSNLRKRISLHVVYLQLRKWRQGANQGNHNMKAQT